MVLRSIICILICWAASFYIHPVIAEIYKYQDENGRWHYLDKKPEHIDVVERVEEKLNILSGYDDGFSDVLIPDGLCSEDLVRRKSYQAAMGGYLGKKGDFDVENRGVSKENPVLYARNDFFSPVELKLFFSSSRNIISNPAFPMTKVIAPQSTFRVAEIYPEKPERSWSYQYQYRYQLGDPTAQHDGSCYYLPPVPPGQHFSISQAFNGSFSHNTKYNRYAIDVAMPEGTPIYAMRDGLVVSRKQKYVLAGLDQSFLSRANSLYVLHGDGSIGIYAHLQFKTLMVREGMKIQAGDVIARSGNTGFSSGPHLHFEVVMNNNLELISQPFALYLDGKPVTPQQGMTIFNQAK